MNKICVYYNFENTKLEKIVKGIFDFFYYNNNLLFSLSACQVEVVFYNIKTESNIENLDENFNILLLDEQYIAFTINKKIDSLIKKFEKNESVIIFLDSSPINLMSTNYLYFDNYCDDAITIKIINAIAIKYIQKYYQQVEVFISYARADGTDICLQISNRLNNYLGLQKFVDVESIALGEGVQNKIETKCTSNECYMLYILTDIYKDRYYCNLENYYAKISDRPGIIYNCIKMDTIRTPLLTNSLEVIQSDNSMELLINGLCQLIIRNKVYRYNAEEIKKRNYDDFNQYEITNNKFDYSALSLGYEKIIYPGNPIYTDESNLYLKIKDIKAISYMECIFNINKKLNIAISTSEVETSYYAKLLSEAFFDLIIQCLIFSGCKIHTALSIYYNNSKLKRIMDIANRYYDKHLNLNNFEAVCINYIPFEDYNNLNPKIIAENKKVINFICCNQNIEKFNGAREKMISSCDCLIIFGGKTYANIENSGIYKEYQCALEQNKPVIIIPNVGGASQELAKRAKNNSKNVNIVRKNDIYSILEEITSILNTI